MSSWWQLLRKAGAKGYGLVAVLLLLTLRSYAQAPHYSFRDYPLDSLRLLSQDASVPDTMRAYFHNRLAARLIETNSDQAVKQALYAVKFAHRTGYVRAEINSLKVLGNMYYLNGKFPQAVTALQRGILLAKQTGRKLALADLYYNLSTVYFGLHWYERSISAARQAEVIYRATPGAAGERIYLGDVYQNLYLAQWDSKQFGPARRSRAQAIAAYKQAGQQKNLLEFYLKVAERQRQLHAQGDSTSTAAAADSAAFFYQQVLARLGKQGSVNTFLLLAQLNLHRGHYKLAQHQALAVLALGRQRRILSYEHQALTLLAQLAAAQHHYEQAYQWLTQATRAGSQLLDEEKNKALVQQQGAFDVKLREAENVRLHQQNKAVVERSRLIEKSNIAITNQKRQLALTNTWLYVAVLLLGFALLIAVIFFQRLRISRRQLLSANQVITQQKDEKEVLVQEIQHRVKNNLQLLDSLLAWESRASGAEEVERIVARSRTRIQSMALVHNHLYRAADLAKVQLDAYLNELLHSLHNTLTSPAQPIALQLNLAPYLMDAKDSNALGLVVNEIVTNTYKHAFKGRARGTLAICLRAVPGGGFSLSIEDDGVGLPPTGLTSHSGSMGMRLVQTLVKQLRAQLLTGSRSEGGTRLEILKTL